MLLPADVRELSQIIHDAHDRDAPLEIVGGGSWHGCGWSSVPDTTCLRIGALTGIVEYVPGDLTLTARAGTTLAEIDDTTASHAQWCPVLPWGENAATLGAVFATATPGPFERTLGRPRDLALGLEFVDGTGATVRAGGRVVKNVAGFDLTRLLVGSWGTLGVITEISVRLRARPAFDETWAMNFDWDDETAQPARHAFERGPYAPLALRRLEAADRRALGLAEDRTILARIGGNASFVAAARQALRTLGDADSCDASIWDRYRSIHAGAGTLQFSTALSSPLARRVKRQFDPKHILNRGLFGEEAG